MIEMGNSWMCVCVVSAGAARGSPQASLMALLPAASVPLRTQQQDQDQDEEDYDS